MRSLIFQDGRRGLGYASSMSTFQSKYDLWLVLLLAATVGVEGFGIVSVWTGDAPWVIRVLTSLVLVGAASLILWTLVTTDYRVTSDALRVRSGPLRWTIPLSSIRSVQPSRSVVAGPAWSLDRLRIETSEEALLISPKDRAGFLEALLQRDPALHRDGDRVTRAAARP
jgi:uncharacterized membrane protein YdbT with pleckstrin-like domain